MYPGRGDAFEDEDEAESQESDGCSDDSNDRPRGPRLHIPQPSARAIDEVDDEGAIGSCEDAVQLIRIATSTPSLVGTIVET